MATGMFKHEYEWPINLAADVVGVDRLKNRWGDNLENRPADLEGSIEYIIRSLDPIETKCILLRYKDLMVYKDIGFAIGNKSLERARQRITKTLRKLRHPEREKFIIYGVKGVMDDMKKKYTEELNAMANKTDNPDNSKRSMGIEYLDLSARSYNNLFRADARTVGDVIKFFRTDTIYKLRNLGRKSIAEIYDKLVAFGIDPKDLEVDPDLITECAHNDRNNISSHTAITIYNKYEDLFKLINSRTTKELQIIIDVLGKLKDEEELMSIIMTTSEYSDGSKTIYEIYCSKPGTTITLTHAEKKAIIETYKSIMKLTYRVPNAPFYDDSIPYESDIFKKTAASTADLYFSDETRKFIDACNLKTVFQLLMYMEYNPVLPVNIDREIRDKLNELGLTM